MLGASVVSCYKFCKPQIFWASVSCYALLGSIVIICFRWQTNLAAENHGQSAGGSASQSTQSRRRHKRCPAAPGNSQAGKGRGARKGLLSCCSITTSSCLVCKKRRLFSCIAKLQVSPAFSLYLLAFCVHIMLHSIQCTESSGKYQYDWIHTLVQLH